jgi:hypothetical protein
MHAMQQRLAQINKYAVNIPLIQHEDLVKK